EQQVRTEIRRSISIGTSDSNPRIQVTSRSDVFDTVQSGPQRREGVLTLFSVFAFAVAILVILVTSGIGLKERRREIGILKATGWQTDELILRSAVEGILLA